MSKASLETLARTMSVTFLALTVIVVGQEQVKPAEASQHKMQLNESNQKILDKKVKKITQRNLPASKRQAPKDVQKRGIWLKELLREAGFRGEALRTAWAVVMRESTGRPNAYNGNTATGDNSYGIFQINMIGDLGVARREKFGLKSNKELFDPLTNAEIAYYMTKGGKDWSSWDIDKSGYNGGVGKSRYQDWLAQYPKEG